ncbi:MAG: hypothetical protein WBL29_02005 [Burkholderiales bacterium]
MLVVYVGSDTRYVRDVCFAERRVRVTTQRDRAAQFTQPQSEYYLGRLAAEKFPYQFGKVAA